MSWTLLRATLHQRRASMLWFSVGLVFYSWLMVWFWPQIGGGQYAELVENMPPEMLALFGGNDISFASMGGYFQTEYLGLMWMVIVGCAIVMYGVGSLAGDIGRGTMELTLSQPISRLTVVLTRIAVLVVYVLILAAATFVPIQVFGPTYDVDLTATTFWLLFALGSLFMLALGGISMLASSIFRDSGKPAGIAAGLLVVMWVLDLVSNVSEAAELFDPVNLVGYWQPGKIINDNVVAAEAWWVYGVVAVIGLIGAVLVFRRRDVA
ncbi:MAG: hypothetical protein Kow0067_16620 [Coriobacteriia bacterium]